MKTLALCSLLALAASRQEEPVSPYVDPTQLDLPFPKHSHLKQPWRAWMETRRGVDFLDGIGINYNVPANDELAVRLLAEAGFRAARKEIGWGSVAWDESGINDAPRLLKLLALFKKHSIRPTFLLNCHQGAPCPTQFFEGKLLEDAPKGATKVKLADTGSFTIGRTGLSGLTDYWAAEALVTAVDKATGECALSKPLPKELKAGKIPMATLKYLPLHPPGTPEFEETVQGWIRYATLVGTLSVESGIDDFDLEIYNELTFGTKFLDIRNYIPDRPKHPKDLLNEGGTCWELARRIVEAVRKGFPKARCIWGFSNTTFYHCAVDRLPPGMDGQSYHPYGTGTRRLPEQEYHKENPQENVDGWTPQVEIRMPEGWISTFVQTESLTRLINPKAREKHPPGVERFRHYMTEHGVLPAECGVKDEAGAWALKTKCALRSYAFWLNKGVDVLHYFCAYEKEATGFGLLPPDLPKLPPDARFDDVATPPLWALRNLIRPFAGSGALEKVHPLEVEVTALGEQKKIFDGKRPLWHRDVFALLPWQLKDGSYAIALYVMTWDAVPSIPEERYRLAIKGTVAGTARLHDPVTGMETPVKILKREGDRIELEVTAVETPRILVLTP
jgi:hypothetical protein